MTHFNAGERLLFDTETDNPDPTEAFIIQAALIHVKPGSELRQWKWLVKPRRPIPAEATAVHGISTEQAERDGEPVHAVISELAAILTECWTPACPLVGHNIGYDITVTDRELGRIWDRELLPAGPVIDTLLLDKELDKYRAGSRQLSDQCRHYGLELGADAHDAFADALAAGRLLHKMVARCVNKSWPRRGRWGPSKSERSARALVAAGDAHSLHTAQVDWHREGQLGLAEYWRSPKAVEKTWEKVSRGEMTREEAVEWIAGLPEAADRVEAQAQGCWPLIPRLVTT